MAEYCGERVKCQLTSPQPQRPVLSYPPPPRSFWSGIQIIELDATGKPTAGATVTTLASRDDPGDNGAVEGAFLVPRLGAWWLFVSWNHCCMGVNVGGGCGARGRGAGTRDGLRSWTGLHGLGLRSPCVIARGLNASRASIASHQV